MKNYDLKLVEAWTGNVVAECSYVAGHGGMDAFDNAVEQGRVFIPQGMVLECHARCHATGCTATFQVRRD